MNIAYITNNCNQNKTISSKGSVSYGLLRGLSSYYRNINTAIEFAETNPDKYRLWIDTFSRHADDALKFANNISKNMKTIMSRFGRSCYLYSYKSEKNPGKRIFVIESEDSNYKHICGEVDLIDDYRYDLSKINKFTTEILAKINPYIINFRFKIMSKSDRPNPDEFQAQKENWFIENNLIPLNTGIKKTRSLSYKKINELGPIILEQNKNFYKEFGSALSEIREDW